MDFCFALALVFIPVLVEASKFKDRFHEELLLKPFYSNHLYAHFQFTTLWDTDLAENTFEHCHLFPRVLGELIKRYDVEEMHISLTTGLWRYENWGYPVVDAAPGVELLVWFRSDTIDIDKKWKELASSLSGVFCASLNFIDKFNSVQPEYVFRPESVSEGRPFNSSFFRYSALPREIVCTENLTPLKKLLPCESKKGLASLLNSGFIHNTRYHSLSISVRSVCRDSKCEQSSVELKESVSLVYDYLILGSRHWSLRKLFGQGLIQYCSIPATSAIYVDLSANVSTPFQLSPKPTEIIKSVRGGYESMFAKYDLKTLTDSLNLVLTYQSSPVVLLSQPSVLHANQYLAGYGQDQGKIVTKLYNNHWAPLNVVVYGSYPWYVPVYFHTLSVKANGVDLKPLKKKYTSGKFRVRPYSMEILLQLPPQSTTTVSLDFEYMFLKWQEYPPDANHGFYIGSAIVASNLPLARNYTAPPLDGSTLSTAFNASRSYYPVKIRTEIMLITLPTPDFSMPYNVICLACTVVALAFGPLHNITTKKLVLRVCKDNFAMVILKEILYKFVKKEKTE